MISGQHDLGPARSWASTISGFWPRRLKITVTSAQTCQTERMDHGQPAELQLEPGKIVTLYRLLLEYLRRFGEARVPLLAAGLAYYATFSLFPLLLLGVAGFGYALRNNPELRTGTLEFMSKGIQTNFPTSANLLNATLEDLKTGLIDRVQVGADASGLIGLISLIWASSGFFTVLQGALNVAIPGERTRSVWFQRGIAIASILLLGTLVLMLSLVSIIASGLTAVPALQQFAPFSSSVFPAIGAFVTFTLAFRVLPTHRPSWRTSSLAALPTALTWQAARLALGYLTPLASFQATYGVFAGFLLLLAWLYLEMQIMLMGAVLAGMIEAGFANLLEPTSRFKDLG
jgi:membrane protein